MCVCVCVCVCACVSRVWMCVRLCVQCVRSGCEQGQDPRMELLTLSNMRILGIALRSVS